MPKNVLTITKTIDNCSQCEYHSMEQLRTPDPFECDMGIFCTKAQNPDADGNSTISGWTDRRLVVADDHDPRQWAYIPDWCPRLHCA